MDNWNPLEEKPKLQSVRVLGVDLKPGDRVRLRPARQADIFDLALEGKTATIDSIEQNYEDEIYLAVLVDDDPGKDLGAMHQVGHRFFFRPGDVEPLTHPSSS